MSKTDYEALTIFLEINHLDICQKHSKFQIGQFSHFPKPTVAFQNYETATKFFNHNQNKKSPTPKKDENSMVTANKTANDLYYKHLKNSVAGITLGNKSTKSRSKPLDYVAWTTAEAEEVIMAITNKTNTSLSSQKSKSILNHLLI